MSWDVNFSTPDSSMGSKAEVREKFLVAYEHFTGQQIPRKGPTKTDVDPSFQFEALFIGSSQAVGSLCLAFQIISGDPHQDDTHPVWKFIRKVAHENGWQAVDTFTGNAIVGKA